jgi:Zn-dependent protease
MSYFERREDMVIGVPRSAYRTSPIFLGILAVFVLSCVLAWTDTGSQGLDVLLMVLSGWLVSLCLHEFAHAFVAYKFGDLGVAQRGYLQLNPLKYTHWLFSIALPILFILAGGIALPGGAVMIDHQYIRDRRKETAISLAGPAVNLLITAALIIPFAAGAGVSTTGDGFVIVSHPAFWSGLAYLAFFQLMAGIFNLIPIPGLDGANAILPWLSPQWQRGFAAIRPFGFFIVVLLLWRTSIGQSLVNGIANTLVSAGIPGFFINNGQQLFGFWRN